MTAVQDGPTSIRVSWTPSSDATGYMIHYTSSRGDSGSEDISGGHSDSHTLTGLVKEDTYTISIMYTRALKCETLGGIFLVHAPFGQSVLCSQHVKTPSLSIENLQRKGPTHNTTVCTCTSFFTCFTCSFSCFAHIIALFALYRSLTLCLLCFAGNTCPHGQAYLRTCSVASHCGHTFLKRIYIPDCRVPSNRPSSRELPVIGFYRACAEYKRTRKEIKWHNFAKKR